VIQPEIDRLLAGTDDETADLDAVPEPPAEHDQVRQ
jgi:hypothetical protein